MTNPPDRREAMAISDADRERFRIAIRGEAHVRHMGLLPHECDALAYAAIAAMAHRPDGPMVERIFRAGFQHGVESSAASVRRIGDYTADRRADEILGLEPDVAAIAAAFNAGRRG